MGRRVGHASEQEIRADLEQGARRSSTVWNVQVTALALLQLTLHLRLGEEDAAAQERDVHPALLRGRSLQEGPQLLRLLVGKRQRVVEGATALARQSPSEALVAQPTTEVLDLDQEQAGRSND